MRSFAASRRRLQLPREGPRQADAMSRRLQHTHSSLLARTLAAAHTFPSRSQPPPALPPDATVTPWVEVGDSEVRLLRDGTQAFPAMLEAIRAAKHEVLLEVYWWANDHVGRRFRDALCERAREGVCVRLIYDSIGSLQIDDQFLEPLRQAGAQAEEYHPISPLRRRFRLDRLALRNHRKNLVVDGHHGFTGGINIADEWEAVEAGGQNWRDDVIEMRGPVAQELRTLFYETWQRCGRARPGDIVPLSAVPSRDVWLMANRLRWSSRRTIRRFYLARIRGARERIDIANAYFLPDKKVERALRHAARRGVQVRVLVPLRSDLPIVQLAVEYMIKHLLKAGIRAWFFPDRVLHSKTAIIDRSFFTTGSFNLDHRSVHYNLECNVAVIDETLVHYARIGFEADLARSVPAERVRWTRTWWRRALGWLIYQFRALL